MKQAIVSGATGFIGSAFVNYLTKKGVEVLALGRKKYSEINARRAYMLSAAKYVQVDMNNISCLPTLINDLGWKAGSDCVFFNLAWAGDGRLSDLNIGAQFCNVSQAVSALEVASFMGCSRFIQVGTMEEAFTLKYLDLDHRFHAFYNRHVIYSVAKMAAKQALKVRSSQLGIDFIYVLHSHVMGPDDDKDSFLQVTLLKLIRDEELIFSSGEQYFDVISLEDCAMGYYLICNKGISGEDYWVGSGDPRRLREYIQRMYALFPTGKVMNFGKLKYNDIVLDKNVFSIAKLVKDTGYAPCLSYEQTVIDLHKYLSTLTAD